MSLTDDGWFWEKNELWPGQALSLRVKRILHRGRTMFQEVLVFESEAYGNVLVLDGVIQATERDEFAYQEMISHIPLFSHKDPKRVLIVGGGDGGCAREALKHSCVESIDLVEIDPSVIELSKKYLPSMGRALTNEKVHVHIQDGFEYLQSQEEQFDVIISDTSDPEGPAEVLFEEGYFKLLHRALKPGGIVSMQASENVWLKIGELTKLQQTCRKVFPQVKYAATCVPTYTSGQLGLIICAKSGDQNLFKPSRTSGGLDLRYYTPHMHEASFVLPTFARDFIDN